MAKIHQQLTDLIGHTPLLELQKLARLHQSKARIIAKLEYFNPGGSVKDRVALANDRRRRAQGNPEARSCYH